MTAPSARDRLPRYLNVDGGWLGLTGEGLEAAADGSLVLARIPDVGVAIGPPLSGTDPLAGPGGLAVVGAVGGFVSDPAANVVWALTPCVPEQPVSGPDDATDPAGVLWSQLNPGSFGTPRGLLLGPRGRLYVADTGHDQVQLLEPSTGALVGRWDGLAQTLAARSRRRRTPVRARPRRARREPVGSSASPPTVRSTRASGRPPPRPRRCDRSFGWPRPDPVPGGDCWSSTVAPTRPNPTASSFSMRPARSTPSSPGRGRSPLDAPGIPGPGSPSTRRFCASAGWRPPAARPGRTACTSSTPCRPSSWCSTPAVDSSVRHLRRPGSESPRSTQPRTAGSGRTRPGRPDRLRRPWAPAPQLRRVDPVGSRVRRGLFVAGPVAVDPGDHRLGEVRIDADSASPAHLALASTTTTGVRPEPTGLPGIATWANPAGPGRSVDGVAVGITGHAAPTGAWHPVLDRWSAER